jgi:hypothetical protein
MSWRPTRAAIAGMAVLVAMAVVLSGCARKGPHIVSHSQQSGQPQTSDLQPILDRRALALLHGDQAAFLSDLDPANARLVQHEQMVFANLRQLAPVDVRFILDQVSWVKNVGSGPSVYEFSPVIEVIQLQGDAGPPKVAPGESFVYDVARTGGRWVVTDIVGLTYAEARKRFATTSGYANAPWDLTPLRVVSVGNVQLAADGTVTDLEQYVAAAQDQASQIESLWGPRPRFPKYTLFFTRDSKVLLSWFEPPPTLVGREGFEQPEEGVRTSGVVYTGQYVGTRVVVNLARISQFNDDPTRVIRHELTHAVTARQMAVYGREGGTIVTSPTWAVEGFARFVETVGSPRVTAAVRDYVATGVQQGRFDGSLPLSARFQIGDDQTVAFNYDVSATVFTFVAQLKGLDAAVDFYARVVHEPESAGRALVTQPAFDAICRAELGMSGSDFLSRWSAFVRSGA